MKRILGALALLAGALVAPAVSAETGEVRVSKQFGIGYLPLTIMEQHKLLEKHAKQAGLGEVKATWATFSGGTAINEALLSGNLDLAAGGVGPLLTIWARTKGNLDVKGVASLNSMPLYLTSINPEVKTLKDFTDKDRIALPAVKVSIQAVTLQMAAEQAFGPGQHGKLDSLTVSMAHPDAMAAMMSGKSEVTGHFTSAPFQYQELADPRVRRVVSSYEVLGGPHTFNNVWATAKWVKDNPKTVRAFIAALDESMAMIKADPKGMAKLWIAAEKSKAAPELIDRIVTDPENVFTTTPQNVMRYAEFMHRAGGLKVKPDSWKDVFFEPIHALPGS